MDLGQCIMRKEVKFIGWGFGIPELADVGRLFDSRRGFCWVII
jgi:hypothetical protein